MINKTSKTKTLDQSFLMLEIGQRGETSLLAKYTTHHRMLCLFDCLYEIGVISRACSQEGTLFPFFLFSRMKT